MRENNPVIEQFKLIYFKNLAKKVKKKYIVNRTNYLKTLKILNSKYFIKIVSSGKSGFHLKTWATLI